MWPRRALALACLVALVRAQTDNEEEVDLTPAWIAALPVCADGLVKTQAAEVWSAVYKLAGNAALVWFCPRPADSEMTVYACASTPTNCEKKTMLVGTEMMRMNACAVLLAQDSFDSRVRTCMPWESSGGAAAPMRHFRAQFVKFAKLWTVGATPPPPQDAAVWKCASGADEVRFASQACWQWDAEVLLLRPDYKFRLVPSENRERCELSHTNANGASSYDVDTLVYTPQAAGIRTVYTQCKSFGRGSVSVGGNGGLLTQFLENGWSAWEKQFHDYARQRTPTTCTDSVTEPCVDNVYSFFAKECVWVAQTSERAPLSFYAALKDKETDFLSDFRAYGNNRYVMNLGARHVEVRVRRSDALPYETWSGDARELDADTASLYVTETAGFSCSGCQGLGEAPLAPGAPCGVPQACGKCETWQRVLAKSTLSRCTPTFADRACAECPAHQVSAGKDKQTQYECAPCPPLKPMRREKQQACAACEHTQYFDATSAAGCVYYASVLDGMAFTGGARFAAGSADEYRPPGSVRAPEAVPAEHFRTLAADSNAWYASTSAQRCSAVSVLVLNASASAVLARNVYGRRVRFRSLCGHLEMTKSGDAMVQALNCAGGPLRLSELVSSGGAFTLERRFEDNRIAEIKHTASGADCFYELRREGRTDDCTYCSGTQYTKDCGPTYYAELAAPSAAGAGTCEPCGTRCPGDDQFFNASAFSCWSNGTQRVQGNATYGSLLLLQPVLARSMNYWYKPAECRPCATLSAVGVPRLVTRCGNKVTFETWHQSDETTVSNRGDKKRPKRTVCCAVDRDTAMPSGVVNDNKRGVRCADTLAALALATPTPACEPTVSDLETSYEPFCPPGWFLDRSAPGCQGELAKWDNACCSQCARCEGAGRLQTFEYRDCPGDTDFDTQLAGCVTTCAEKNYQDGNRCVACESCA